MPDVSVSGADVAALAAKLDKLDQLLNDKERAILLVLFGIAATEFGRTRLASTRVMVPRQPVPAPQPSPRRDGSKPLPPMGPTTTLPPPPERKRDTLPGIGDSLQAAFASSFGPPTSDFDDPADPTMIDQTPPVMETVRLRFER